MNNHLIQIKNLTKKFGKSVAIQGISLSIKQGEIFGIIGMSGAGKSTLMRCLSLLESPSEGNIFIGGKELTALTSAELRKERKRLGVIFQHFNLFFSRNVIDNIAFPLEINGVEKRKRERRAEELLQLVGLKGKEACYPAELSGGQKQRVAIARGLITDPQVLLCDEATSSLDPSTTRSILDLLAKINEDLGVTIIMITHEMEVIKQICSQVAVLEHGKIVETGSAVDLFSHPEHPTTKKFLQNLVHEIPEHLVKKGDLLRLFFKGESASRPVISRLIREYPVEVNILLGGIDMLKAETIGNLVISLTGPPEARLQACHFLDLEGVRWEKIT